ncbi:MAG: insulinase family protein [Thermoguttaceae bacterium]|nr:insulinase family protein [Thermoguttaceae bacterium]
MNAMEKNQVHIYENGLVLLAEDMSWSESFAVSVRIPAGTIYAPGPKAGLAALTCEMTNRGAGNLGNREFLEAFENLGVDSFERATTEGALFRAVGLAGDWERALELLAMQIREPLFPEEEFESCLTSQIQEIAAKEDEPTYQVGAATRRLFYPAPWGESRLGTKETLEKTTLDDVVAFHRDFYRPNGAIVAVSGRFDWERVKAKIGELFGGWSPLDVVTPTPVPNADSTASVPFDSAQTHLSFAFPTVPLGDPSYHAGYCGAELLGGGMSSRFFTEVREKRGLCYSVQASISSLNDWGGVFCYCGSTAERAQEALDVMIAQIDRLSAELASDSELERVKIRTKSSLVMENESPGARSYALVSDWLRFKRIRSTEEIFESVNKQTAETIREFFAERAPIRFRLATLGSKPLEIAPERLY